MSAHQTVPLLPRAMCVFCGENPATGLDSDKATDVRADFAIVGTLCRQCRDADEAMRFQGEDAR